MTDIGSLYPRPPAQQDPIALLSNLYGLMQKSQEYQSQQNIAQAYRRNIKPDGTVDIEGLTRDAANSGFLAPAATQGAMNLGGSQFNLRSSYVKQGMDVLASLRDQGNVNSQTLTGAIMTMVRHGVIPADVGNGLIKDIPPDSQKEAQIQHLYNLSEIVRGGAPEAPTSIVPPGAQAPLNVPAAVGRQMGRGLITPEGQPVGTAPIGAAPPGPPPMPPADVGRPTGPPKNQSRMPMYGGYSSQQPMGAEAEVGTGMKMAADLQDSAGDIPNQRSMLSLMQHDVEQAEDKFGPSAAYEKAGNVFVNRFLGFHPTMTREQVAALDSFDKLSKQIALSQAQTIHPTNDYLSSATGSNPNIGLSGFSNKMLISMLNGRLDALQYKAQAWNDARRNGVQPGQYQAWQDQFNRNFDPRVFQFDRMPKDQQAKFLQTINTVDGSVSEFDRNLTAAINAGLVKGSDGQKRRRQ